jgi:hypothetical protein
VNVGQERIRFGGQDRTALDWLSLRVPPPVPETRERKQFAVIHLETVWLLRLAIPLPLIEAIGWNETPLGREWFPE